MSTRGPKWSMHVGVHGAFLICQLVVACTWANALAAPETVGMSAARLRRAHNVLQAAVEQRIAGSAVGLIARDDQIVFLDAVGEMEPGVPMTTEAITRMASIGKSITATAVLMLYEDGKLRLADPVSRFLPEFADVQVNVAGADGVGTTRVAPVRPVTIHDLLAHEAGFAAEGPELDALWERAQTVGEFARGLAKIPLRYQPGTHYEYGPAYEVLAAVVESATGQAFADFLQQRILTPLHMEDTMFFVPKEKLARYAGIYMKDADGSLTMFRRRGEEEAPSRFTAGGGGLRGTVGDYYRFASMLLHGGMLDGERFLSPKTVELMTTDHVGARYPSERGDYGWGLGVGVRTRLAATELESVGSFGWNGGTGTLYVVDPRERMIVIVFVPSQPRTPGIWGDADVRTDFVTAAYQAIVESYAAADSNAATD